MHLFAGIGGGMLADLILGHHPVVAIESDSYCCEVLRQRADEGWFPDLIVIEDDIRNIDPTPFKGRVDSIHAGFPCQPFSANWDRRMFDDERGKLFFEVIRFADILRPQYICLENVPTILTGGYHVILGALAEIGYDARWTCLPAAATGAPHHRNRWWALAYPHSQSAQDYEPGTQPSQARQHQRPAIPAGLPWETESRPHPVVDGDAPRLAYDKHAVKALGNAQVPLQAAMAYAMLGYPVEEHLF